MLTFTSSSCQPTTDESTDQADGRIAVSNQPVSDTFSTDTFNHAAGIQTTAPQYGFNQDSTLVEPTKAIRAMGSNLIKISLSSFSYGDLDADHEYQHRFTETARDIPDFNAVLDMDDAALIPVYVVFR